MDGKYNQCVEMHFINVEGFLFLNGVSAAPSFIVYFYYWYASTLWLL
jgi:hypothetical protein